MLSPPDLGWNSPSAEDPMQFPGLTCAAEALLECSPIFDSNHDSWLTMTIWLHCVLRGRPHNV